MLKVLIVDDEIKVCRLIEYLIDWKSLGLEIIGTVHDGQSALDFIQGKCPDIVITDIRMPVVDGLELIRKVKESNRNIYFIIISGYSDFSYAQKAIKYGVDDYLLKPLKKKELLQTLNKLIMKHQAVLQDNTEKEALRKRINNSEKKLKVNLLNEIIDKSDVLKGKTVKEVNEEYCCNFSGGYYQMILVQPIISFPDADDRIYDFVTSKLKDVMNNELSIFNEVIITIKEENVYCLINGTDEQLAKLKRQLKKIKTFILGFRDVIGEVKIYIALSAEKINLQDVLQCVDEVKLAILNKIVINTDLLEYPGIPDNGRKLDDIIDSRFRKDFLLNLETMNQDEQSKLLEKLKNNLKSDQSVSGQFILKVYLEIIDLLNYGIKAYNIVLKNNNFQNSLLKDIYRFGSVDEIFENLQLKLTEAITEWKNEKKFENTKPIRIAKQYINENYYQPLTLEMIGEKIGFNPAYFSSIFKKETGINFVDYLTEIRINNAKRILLETDKSIADISEEVGFNDIKYFTKKFKKLTCLSPSDYRKLYS